MPRPARTDGLDKFRRYRAPGFREEAHRQAQLLRGAPEEREALEFIEAAADRNDDAA